MIKLIEYIKYCEGAKSYTYKIIDSEFQCELEVFPLTITSFISIEDLPWVNWDFAEDAAALVAAITTEYQRRNYSHDEIVKNLFKCNIYMSENKFSFEDILDWQYKYTDIFFKDINFSKLYYQDLKDMWNNHKMFM